MMPDGGEGGLDGIAGADALPMLCWEVEEGHEFLTIFLQAHSGHYSSTIPQHHVGYTRISVMSRQTGLAWAA